MTIYYIIIFLLILCGIINLDWRINRQTVLFLSIILIVILTMVGGLRTVGHDLVTYENYFKTIKAFFQEFNRTDKSLEIGYEFLSRATKSISSDFHLFLILFTGFSITLNTIVFYKWSPYPLTSLMLFCSYAYFIMVMGQMRQPFAVALMYLGILPLLLKKRIIFAVALTALIGILFHKSILMVIPLIIICRMPFSKTQIAIISVCAATCFILASALLPFILSIIPGEFYYADTILAYLTYRSHGLSFTPGMLERIGICVILFYYSNKYQLYKRDQLLRILINIYFLGVALYFFFIGMSTEFAARGTFAMSFSMYIALPLLLKKINHRDKWILASVICMLSMYHFCEFLINPTIYNPYKSIIF